MLHTKQKWHTSLIPPYWRAHDRPFATPRFLWLSSNCWDVYRVRLGGRVKLGLLQSIIAPQAPTSVHKSPRPMKKSSPRAGRAIRVDFAKRPPGAGNWQQLKPPASPLCSSSILWLGWQIRRNRVKLGRLEWMKSSAAWKIKAAGKEAKLLELRWRRFCKEAFRVFSWGNFFPGANNWQQLKPEATQVQWELLLN